MTKSRKRKAKCGPAGCERPVAAPLRAPSGSKTPLSALRPLPLHRGLTLVELLVTMVIIAIISAAILGTASSAIEYGRQTHTQQLVTRIHTLIMERWASYETRKIDVHPSILQALDQRVQQAPANQYAARNAARGQMLADIRLVGMRELIRYEMPDRFADFGSDRPVVLEAMPALAQSYYRRVQQASGSAENQDAECLYMTVMLATGDGEARTLFGSKDIGDEDGDGLPEFLDGWGRPIGWIRWAPGFNSDIQPLVPVNPTTMWGLADEDHDPFDLYRRDQPEVTTPAYNDYPNAPSSDTNALRTAIRQIRTRNNSGFGAFRLTPLVFSRGPDETLGLWRVPKGTFTETQALDPYSLRDSSTALYGTIDEEAPEAHEDNIHNHLFEY